MIIDASALLAIVLAEPDAARYARAIARSDVRLMPSVAWFEASLRVDADADPRPAALLDDFIRDFHIEILPFTREHMLEARRARQRYGKPHHPARLNFGDCMVYGAARHEGEKLLFKGNDFSQTDIEPALKD